MNNAKETHFIVQSAAANMPASCWGRYDHHAVLEVDAGLEHVAMISEHARGCHEVVYDSGPCFSGITEKCASDIALAECQEMAQELNDRKDAEKDRRAYLFGIRLYRTGNDPLLRLSMEREYWEARGDGFDHCHALEYALRYVK